MPSAERPLLPPVETPQALDALCRDEAMLRPGVDAICRRHVRGTPHVARFADGSLPVYAVGDALVLKLYPPCYVEERDREGLVLGVLEGKLQVPTARVEVSGELDGWGYLLMERLSGEGLARVWPRLRPTDRLSIAQQIGAMLAELHDVRDPRLAALIVDWDSFLAQQRASAVERQRARGLDAHWLEQIEPFLDGTPFQEGRGSVLLHTEVMREHLLVSPDESAPGAGVWRVTGLYDFEPAMIGAAGYEFASVGLFVSCTDAAILRNVFSAYGVPGERIDAELSRRCLAYALLHKYSHIPWYMERMPPPPGARTLEELAEHWWGVG